MALPQLILRALQYDDFLSVRQIQERVQFDRMHMVSDLPSPIRLFIIMMAPISYHLMWPREKAVLKILQLLEYRDKHVESRCNYKGKVVSIHPPRGYRLTGKFFADVERLHQACEQGRRDLQQLHQQLHPDDHPPSAA